MKTSPPYGVFQQKYLHLMKYSKKISPPNGVFQKKYLHLMEYTNENNSTLWSIPALT